MSRLSRVRYGRAGRFAAPVAVNERGDDRQGRPVSPQLPSRLRAVIGSVAEGLDQSEDCLVLTVAAPVSARDLPVMVWFHGGAYMTGGGEAPKYDPAVLADACDAVVVSVTSRLGVLGYLSPSSVGIDNLGLRDQLLALEWVQDHVASFGGDPARVTAFGQSAGADAVLAMMLVPGSERLFGRAILQSAPLAVRTGRAALTAALRKVVDERIGADPLGACVEAVLETQVVALQAAQDFRGLGGLPFAPIAGSDPLPSEEYLPDQLRVAAGRFEVLVGWTRDDAAAFVGIESSPTATDAMFASPATELVRLWRAHGGVAATYRFEAAPLGAPLGACHCMELPYLFGTDWSDAPMLAGQPPHADVANAVRRAWRTVAHSGVGALGGHLTFASPSS